MILDKLTRAEQIRLAAFAEANKAMTGYSLDARVEGAKTIENYIIGVSSGSSE